MKISEVVFLRYDDLLRIHEVALTFDDHSSPGVLSESGARSAVETVEHGYPQSVAEIAATYARNVAINHGFNDANKRTAFLAAVTFLQANGIEIPEEPELWSARMVEIARGSSGTATLEIITEWFTDAMGGDPRSVELE